MARFGDETAGGDTFPCSGDRALLSKFTLGEAGDVTEIVVRFDATSTAGTSIKGLIYSDNAGTPQNRLAIGSAVAVPAGGGLVSSATTASLAAGDYWIGFVANGFNAVLQADVSGGLSRMEATTYASPNASWTQSGTGSAQVNVYAEYTPTGAALDVPLGVFDPLLVPAAWLTPMQVPVAWYDEELIDEGGPAIFTVTGAGGFTLAGAATIERVDVWEYTAVGGFTLAGAAALARTIVPVTAGGFTLAGAAAASRAYAVAAAGGFTLAGAATLTRAYAVAAAGGVVFAGTGAGTLVPAGLNVYEYTGTGGLVLAGTGAGTLVPAVVQPPAQDGAGGQVITMPRRPPRGMQHDVARRREYRHIASGGVVFRGTASVAFERRQMAIPLAVLATL